MKTTRYIAFSLLVFLSFGFLNKPFSQVKVSSGKTALLVAEFDPMASSNHLQVLMCYHFVNGAFVSKEKIITVPTKKEGVKGSYVRFDLGTSTIYRNRYVITSIGNIIDVKEKKLLLAEKDELVGFNGDSIIFKTNDIFKGKYFSVFDLKTQTYTTVANPAFNPNPHPEVEFDDAAEPFKLWAYYSNGKKELLAANAGYGEAAPLVGETPKRRLKVFWLDNSTFLYANYNAAQTDATIYKVNINKSVEKIADITAIPASAENSFFKKDQDGSVFYSCPKGIFLVDIKKKKAEKVQYKPIGNNFHVELDENPKYGHVVKYNDVEIGKYFCNDNAQTTNGHIALQSELVIGTEKYPQGVKVWEATSKKWASLDISDIANIVGWMQE